MIFFYYELKYWCIILKFNIFWSDLLLLFCIVLNNKLIYFNNIFKIKKVNKGNVKIMFGFRLKVGVFYYVGE